MQPLVVESSGLQRPYVLCIITANNGSAPGKAGFKMAVLGDGAARGTVGGGDIERLAIKTALRMLKLNIRTLEETFELRNRKKTARTTMICGGTSRIFFELYPLRERAVLFGGGHIGQSLAPLLLQAGYAVEINDNRNFPPGTFPSGIIVRSGDYRKLATNATLDNSTFAFIFTHGHSHDQVVLKTLLERMQKNRFECRYTGMIGSRTKVREILKKIPKEGISQRLLKRVYTPIGINTGGSSPFEIAVSICAEAQAIRYGRPAGHMREAWVTEA